MTFLDKAIALVNERICGDEIGERLRLLASGESIRVYRDFYCPTKDEPFDPTDELIKSTGEDAEVKFVQFIGIDRGVQNWKTFGQFLARFTALEVLFLDQTYCQNTGFDEFLENTTIKLFVLVDMQSKLFHEMHDEHIMTMILGPLEAKQCAIVVFRANIVKDNNGREGFVKYKFDKDGFVKTVQLDKKN